MLNVAGPDYDFGQVLGAVLMECEHRRKGIERKTLDQDLRMAAAGKLATIKAAYDELCGTPGYWQQLQREVMETAMPQYLPAAGRMTDLERNGYGVLRGGDLAARFLFALLGLVIGSLIVALPFIPIFEDMFAFALTVLGFIYPDMVRYNHQRRHADLLNRLVLEAEQYQARAQLQYMTTKELHDSFSPPRLEQ